jgi:hypothetical protein
VRQSLDAAAGATCDVVNDPNCDGVADTAPDDAVTDITAAAQDTGAPQDTAATNPTGSLAVVPPPTAASTTTTVSAAVIPKLALGDSVMLGAATQLAAQGFTVDAVESRAFVNGLETVQTLKEQGRLGDVVVVHLGTNGPISESDMTKMMEALADVPQVLLLTVDVPRDYTAGNNGLIYDTANTYPNVSLLDWAGLDDGCPGECFYSDGYHLRPAGQEYYAQLIGSALQTPP